MQQALNILIAILLGSLIGLQREFTKQHNNQNIFAGIRTFILIALLGSVLGYLTQNIESTYVIIGFIFTILFALVAYATTTKKQYGADGTTQVALILTYILGVMTTTQQLEIAVILAILIASFLTFKEKLHNIAKKIDATELVAMVEFALIAFVILPFLPNHNYSPTDIPGITQILQSLGTSPQFLTQLNVLNPYNIWLMVIFIAGINLAGYFLVKLLGTKKGYELTGLVGGLISSTAVTISMSQESKKKITLNPLLIATILASTIMFIRVIFEVAILNYKILPALIIPLGAMILTSIAIVGILHRKKDQQKTPQEKVETSQPFALLPAIKFGLFFALILLLSKTTQLLFGQTGIYITSVLSGLADVDAITLTMSNLSAAGSISTITATTAIILAVASNTLVKAGIAYYFGTRKFGTKILIAFATILAIGLAILLL
jgi:uncharacterized membrane protein (DUF4010 family)